MAGKIPTSFQPLMPPGSAATDWIWVPFQVDRRFDGYRVDRFLSQRLAAYSRSRVQRMLIEARVLRADRPLKASAKVRGGDRLLIAYPRRPEEPLSRGASLPVLFEDDSFIVINKPANLLSHPTDRVVHHTVLGVLRHARPDLPKVHLLHRLDRETSGVLALAKTVTAARFWTEAMAARRIQKEYLALVAGIPMPLRGSLAWPIGREGGAIKVRQSITSCVAVEALTHYVVEKASDAFSLVRAFPQTGRLHQIRVHFAALGHPVLGDVLYNGTGQFYLRMVDKQLRPEDRLSLGFPRLALHAARLSFPHPVSRSRVTVDAPVPDDLQGKIDTLSSR